MMLQVCTALVRIMWKIAFDDDGLARIHVAYTAWLETKAKMTYFLPMLAKCTSVCIYEGRWARKVFKKLQDPSF